MEKTSASIWKSIKTIALYAGIGIFWAVLSIIYVVFEIGAFGYASIRHLWTGRSVRTEFDLVNDAIGNILFGNDY